MSRLFDRITSTIEVHPAAVLMIRLIVGAVFLSEGIQKFLYPDALGVGRFIKIGIPAPEILAPFVGGVESAGGALVLLGLLTRPAALLLAVNISFAIATTKMPMLIESGFWKMAHEARTDWSMLLGSLALVIIGGGKWSLDWKAGHRSPASHG
jgi:uncharacterized membrane protein YphA (DoxX/SURF4 family)